MKKTLYSIAALSLAFFASCAEDSFNAAPQMGDAITFQINEDLVTRGTPITKKNIVKEMGTMNVVVRDDNGKNPFSDDNTTLTLSGGESGLTGSISPNRYWSANMGADDQYHFFVVPQGIKLNPSYADGKFSFTYTQPYNNEKNSDGVDGKDLIVAASSAKKGEAVGITFRHALTAVKVVYDKPINAHDISSITVWDAIASASCTYDGETFDWNTTGAGTITLTQDVNHQIVSSEGELVGTEESTFMLIPGGKLNLSVEIDGKDYYLTTDSNIDLVAGQTVVINITDEAKKTEGSGSNKVITYDEDTKTYSITIDAWVTGEVSTTTVSQPLDVVLVLDMSGSMDEDFSNQKEYIARPRQNYSYISLLGRTYYYKDNEGNYHKLNRDHDKGGLLNPQNCYIYYTVGNTKYYLYGTSVSTDKTTVSTYTTTIWNGILYENRNPTRLDALKESVSAFIDEIESKSTTDATHQISIVTFASENKSTVVSELTSDFASLKAEVEDLSANGGTIPSEAMTKANSILNGVDNSRKSSKLVVMFTDGVPDGQQGDPKDKFSDDNKTEASATISASKTLKDNKVSYRLNEDGTYTSEGITVFSVGIFTDPFADIVNYMDYVSSNYPSATSMDKPGNPITEKKYSMTASSAEALNEIFKSIAQSVGGATADLGTETTISDAMSSVFTLPEGLTQSNVKNYVKCYEIDFAGYDGKIALWDENSWNDITDQMEITVNDNTFEVKGFDFKSNYCAVDSSTKEPRGKKLQIVISGLKYSGEGDLTNMAGSGIYDAQGNLVNEFTPAPLE